MMRSLLIFALISVAILALSCQPETNAPPQTDAGPHKTKHAQITLTDIRKSAPKNRIMLEHGTQQLAVAAGDTFRIGDQLHTEKGVEAELRFGSGTLVLLHENSTIQLGTTPEVTQLSGQVTVARKLGAPEPFVLQLQDEQLSVINGKSTIRANNKETIITVISGELLNVKQNRYYSSGETFRLANNTAPKNDVPHPKADPDSGTAAIGPAPVGPMIAGNWNPSVSPVESAAIIPMGQTIRRGIGTLTARNPRTGKTAQNAMKMNSHLVNIQMQEGVAITQVEESFTNQSNAVVEASYRFLVPADAHITRLALDVNGRIEEGEVLEKKRAARIFKQIVDDSVRPKDPALLEWEEGAAFKMKIFPIKPKETRRVFLTYTTALGGGNGYTRYEYPLAGPSGAAEVDKFAINATVHTATPIRSIRTPLFNTKLKKQDKTASLSYATSDFAPAYNFVITVESERRQAPLRTLVQTEKNGESFAMFLWEPNSQPVAAEPPPRHVIVMVDTSYGTEQSLLEMSAATLVELLGGLGHRDRFNVLACDSSCRPLYDHYVEPNAAHLIDVTQKLQHIFPGGSSNLLGNFSQAFATASKTVPTTVVYLGDGIATTGELQSNEMLTLLEAIRPQNIMVHTVGIGPHIDAPMLRRLASRLGGANYNLSFGESVGSASWQLSKMFTSDGLTDIVISGTDDEGRAINISPARIGFLPSGQSATLYAKLNHLTPATTAGARVQINARKLNGTPFSQSYRVQLSPGAPAPGFVSRLWAGQAIENRQFENGSPSEIIDLSRRYRIASRMTSWIVLENQRMYELFNVQRTDAEEYDGGPVDFSDADEEVVDSEDEEASPTEITSLAASASAKSSSGMVARGAGTPSSRPANKKRAAKMDMLGADPLSSVDDLALDGRFSHRASETAKSIEAPRRSYPECSGPRYVVEIASFTDAKRAGFDKADQLQQQLQQHPLSRSLHRRYVRQLAKLTDRPRGLEAADQWRITDPYSTAALRAFAAETARSGNREQAIRLYGAQSEIAKNSAQTHQRLGRMQRTMGNHFAAAGHFKAFLALTRKPTDNDTEDYLFELILSGQHALFTEEANRLSIHGVSKALQRKIEALRESIHTGIVPERTIQVQKGALQITLLAHADVDIHLVDPFGRVSSALWPFGADAEQFTARTAERFFGQMSLFGTYKVVVTQPTPTVTPISGTVTIRLKGKQQKVHFQLNNSEQIVAKITYQQLPHKRCYPVYY